MSLSTGIMFLALGVTGIVASVVLLIMVLHTTSKKLKEEYNRVWTEYQ